MTSLQRSNRCFLHFYREAAATHSHPRVLDLGCGEEERLSGDVYGIEYAIPAQRGHPNLLLADLERPLPIADQSFDLIAMNQVVEHIRNLDGLFSECRRILRPGGSLILATPNLASWHNIAALWLGQQAFSQSISERFYLGNRFSSAYREPVPYAFPQHCKILAPRGIKDLCRQYGFRLRRFAGAGVPVLDWIDRAHAPYLVALADRA